MLAPLFFNAGTHPPYPPYRTHRAHRTVPTAPPVPYPASFVKRIMAHLNTWIGNMVGGQVQVNLIGNAGVTGRLWALVLGCCVVFLQWRT